MSTGWSIRTGAGGPRIMQARSAPERLEQHPERHRFLVSRDLGTRVLTEGLPHLLGQRHRRERDNLLRLPAAHSTQRYSWYEHLWASGVTPQRGHHAEHRSRTQGQPLQLASPREDPDNDGHYRDRYP